MCCNTYFDPQGVTIVTGDNLWPSVAQPHQSEPLGGVSHGASAGSGSPLRKSWNRGLRDRSPLQRTLACLYDSVGNSSVNQLQQGQRGEERRSRKKKRERSWVRLSWTIKVFIQDCITWVLHVYDAGLSCKERYLRNAVSKHVWIQDQPVDSHALKKTFVDENSSLLSEV